MWVITRNRLLPCDRHEDWFKEALFRAAGRPDPRGRKALSQVLQDLRAGREVNYAGGPWLEAFARWCRTVPGWGGRYLPEGPPLLLARRPS